MVKDDFKGIKGIGEKITARLHDAGIMTFKQLAEAMEDDLTKISPKTPLEDIRKWQEEAKKYDDLS
jgi:predicted flap endonuclease-1-like 5' DNA nuclease